MASVSPLFSYNYHSTPPPPQISEEESLGAFAQLTVPSYWFLDPRVLIEILNDQSITLA